jgi:hypothetical protein
MRQYGAPTQLTAAGVRYGEIFAVMHQRADQHNYASGFTGGLFLHSVQIELFGRPYFQIVAHPFYVGTNTLKHFNHPADLFYPSYVFEPGRPAV